MRTSTAVRLGSRKMPHAFALVILAFLLLFGLSTNGSAATLPSVSLTSSVPSPQKLGNPIVFTANVNGAPSGHSYGYQFSVTSDEGTQVLSDFSPTATFTWTPYLAEGSYSFSVVVRDTTTTPYVFLPSVSVPFELDPWVTAPLAAGAIHRTGNPLVAFFNAPPCTVGHQVLVRFQPAAPTGTQNPASMTTNFTPCSDKSANFYIAGMYAKSKYLMHGRSIPAQHW